MSSDMRLSAERRVLSSAVADGKTAKSDCCGRNEKKLNGDSGKSGDKCTPCGKRAQLSAYRKQDPEHERVNCSAADHCGDHCGVHAEANLAELCPRIEESAYRAVCHQLKRHYYHHGIYGGHARQQTAQYRKYETACGAERTAADKTADEHRYVHWKKHGSGDSEPVGDGKRKNYAECDEDSGEGEFFVFGIH